MTFTTRPDKAAQITTCDRCGETFWHLRGDIALRRWQRGHRCPTRGTEGAA